jgi:hypothetical protein
VVNVGVIDLQQLAQLRQSTSFQTAASISSANLSRPLGGFFSTRPKNLFIDAAWWRTFCLKERKLTCMFVSIAAEGRDAISVS